MDTSYVLAKNIVDTNYEDLPDEVVQITKNSILDTIGVILVLKTLSVCLKTTVGRRSSRFLCCQSRAPLETIKDVVEEAKKSRGKLPYSTPGVSQLWIFGCVDAWGVCRDQHYPCSYCAGGNPATTAALGSHVSMVCNTTTSVAPHLK